MTNISFFFPEKEKGFALGVNAAGGNLGVAVVQLRGPDRDRRRRRSDAQPGRPDLAAADRAGRLLAWKSMANLSVATSSFRASIAAAKRPHTWIISFLYIGTFGSFIGFSAAFPLLIKTTFPDITVAHIAFLGALVGSVARPFGGKLADRVGGAWVTVCCVRGDGRWASWPRSSRSRPTASRGSWSASCSCSWPAAPRTDRRTG